MENSEMPIEKIVDTEPKKTKKNKTIIGIVNCNNLFVREEPDKESDAIYILNKNDTVIIDEAASTNGFYKVIVKGIIGFCVKNFIDIM